MDIRARRAALRAAFKIAFASSLLGCGGGVVVAPTGGETESPDPAPAPAEPAPAEPAPTEPAPVEPAPTEPAPTEPAPVACAEPAGGWGTYDEASFACCVERIGAAIDRLGPLNPAVDLGDSAEEVGACCQQVTEPNWEAQSMGAPIPYPAPVVVIESCCNVRNGNPSCTPWGPPAPPAMDWDDDLAWLDAAIGGAA